MFINHLFGAMLIRGTTRLSHRLHNPCLVKMEFLCAETQIPLVLYIASKPAEPIEKQCSFRSAAPG